MRKHSPGFLPLASLCLLIALGALPAVAQDGGAPDAATDEGAMMQAMASAATPGEVHERLAESVGSWNMEIKMWMGPGEPAVSSGTAERSMILDGRVLVEEVTSSVMGQTFTGFGMTGYDNVTGKYWGTWNDNMSTGISTSQGTFDAESGVYTYRGETPDPMTGAMKKNRATITLKGGQEIMEMYEMHGGDEVKTMEIVYSRK